MTGRELPPGWVETTVGEVIAHSQNGLSKRRGDDGQPVNVLRLADVEDRSISICDPRSILLTPDEVHQYGLRWGDLIFTRVNGSGENVGRALVYDLPETWAFCDHFIRMRVAAEVAEPRYVALHFDVPATRRIVERGFVSSAGQKTISQKSLAATSIALPPLAEQRRIVEKIEALTARSRRAKEALAALPALLDRYRQSVLAAAFRGELTADLGCSWEPVPLRDLIFDGPTNGYSPKAGESATGTLSLKLSATTSGRMVLGAGTTKRLFELIPQTSKYFLRPGDLLVQRANSLEHLGATAIFDGPPETYVYPDLMMRVRIADEATRRLVWRFMNSSAGRRAIRANATGTAGNMPKINGKFLKSLLVPLPPLEMRAVAADRIDSALAVVSAVEKLGPSALNRLATLDQSILAKAFRGELVPQDPADEPACVLLDRIRAERGAAGAGTARRGRGRRSGAV